MIDAIGEFLSGILWRWRCRSGLSCAHIVIEDCDLPPGQLCMVEWACARCGSWYRSEFLAGLDGDMIELDLRRVRKQDLQVMGQPEIVTIDE